MLLALATAGCAAPATQLVVVVDSDAAPGSFACVGLAASRVGSEEGTTHFVPAEDVSFPLSFGVVPPAGTPSLLIDVEVALLPSCDPPTGPVPRAAARTGFLADRSLALPLRLDDTCGAGCEDGQSCSESGCVARPDVDPSTLSAGGGGTDPYGGTLNVVLVP